MKNIPTHELLATIRTCTSEICELGQDRDSISIQAIYELAARKLRQRAVFHQERGQTALANAYRRSQNSLLSTLPESMTSEDGASVAEDRDGASSWDQVRMRRSPSGFTYFQN